MSDLEERLTASILHARLPLGELIGRLRRGTQMIQDLSIELDRSCATHRAAEALIDAQAAVIENQKREIAMLRAHIKLVDSRERRRLSLVVDNTTPALLRPQAE
jgi:hypothetical protein